MSHDLLFTNETEWNAIDLRALFDLFGEGVLGAGELEVSAGGVGLSVDVAAGSAFVASDEAGDQGKYRVNLANPLNSAAFVAGGIAAAHGALPRVDRIVAHAYDDEADGSGITAFRLEVVTGVATAGATLANNNGIAAMPDNALLLARVLIEAGDVAVDPANIADERELVSVGGGGGAPDAHAASHALAGTDPIPTLPTADEKDALDGAATAADAGNPYVTEADLPGAPPAATLPVTLIDAKADQIIGTAPDAADHLAIGADRSALTPRAAAGAGIEWSNYPKAFNTGTHTARPAASAAIEGAFLLETDTNVLWRCTGGVWLPVTEGQIVKGSDETVNNSATLQDDNELLVPILASEKVFIQLFLIVQGASVNADIKVAFTVPAGATRHQQQLGQFTQGSTVDPGALNAGSPISGLGNGLKGAAYAAWVLNAGTAGNVQMQWAQNAATAEDVTVKAGSLLMVRYL